MTRIDRLLERIVREIHGGDVGPEHERAMRTLDYCEDLLDEHRQWAREMIGEAIDPRDMTGLPVAKWSAIDSDLVRIRNVVDSLTKAIKEVDVVVAKHLGGKNSIEPQRLVSHLDEYRKFLNLQIAAYQKAAEKPGKPV